MSYLAAVCHDIKSNTLEATWIEEILDGDGLPVELKRIKCRNYSVEQKDEFLADCGDAGQKYLTMAEW
tara:strand:+ start:1256 stop:1459 length:204 start_codon:yes stop_codon:yes gene_type:complete